MKKYLLFWSITFLVFLSGCSGLSFSNPFKNTDSEHYFQMAQEYQQQGKVDLALVFFNKADSLSPNTTIILHERGLLKASMELYQEAIADLNKSIELTTDPEQKSIYLENRGLTYLEMGDTTNACADFKTVGSGNSKGYIEKYCK